MLGGPGTGKTSLLVDTAAAHIAAGLEPESLLLLTGSGPLAASTRSAVTARLLAARCAEPCRAVVREPVVRSVHSYAFAVLRKAAARPVIHPAAGHPCRAGRHHPRAARRRSRGTARSTGRGNCARR